jgi:Protein of unknown function (DUF1524)
VTSELRGGPPRSRKTSETWGTRLMQSSKNSLVGNSSFAEKKKILKESTFVLTSEVGKESKWEAKQIKDRQAKLAKLAVETWPIS